jgi:hypothetical protein
MPTLFNLQVATRYRHGWRRSFPMRRSCNVHHRSPPTTIFTSTARQQIAPGLRSYHKMVFNNKPGSIYVDQDPMKPSQLVSTPAPDSNTASRAPALPSATTPLQQVRELRAMSPPPAAPPPAPIPHEQRTITVPNPSGTIPAAPMQENGTFYPSTQRLVVGVQETSPTFFELVDRWPSASL